MWTRSSRVARGNPRRCAVTYVAGPTLERWSAEGDPRGCCGGRRGRAWKTDGGARIDDVVQLDVAGRGVRPVHPSKNHHVAHITAGAHARRPAGVEREPAVQPHLHSPRARARPELVVNLHRVPASLLVTRGVGTVGGQARGQRRQVFVLVREFLEVVAVADVRYVGEVADTGAPVVVMHEETCLV